MNTAPAGSAANATRDAFLGGLVELLQPARGTGHRAGLDAVYLAAAVDPSAQGHVLDLGSGSGAAGFCLAARVPGVRVSLVDRTPARSPLPATRWICLKTRISPKGSRCSKPTSPRRAGSDTPPV